MNPPLLLRAEEQTGLRELEMDAKDFNSGTDFSFLETNLIFEGSE
jgi:hypothetical protein